MQRGKYRNIANSIGPGAAENGTVRDRRAVATCSNTCLYGRTANYSNIVFFENDLSQRDTFTMHVREYTHEEQRGEAATQMEIMFQRPSLRLLFMSQLK